MQFGFSARLVAFTIQNELYKQQKIKETIGIYTKDK
jgi:hypothetical protein